MPCSFGGAILIFLILFNGILQILLKVGKLKKDLDEQNDQGPFNNAVKNPKVIKDIVMTLTIFTNMVFFNIGRSVQIQAPLPYDKLLMAMLPSFTMFGVVTPLVFWFSNKKLRTYALREFWDEAPNWMIQLKEVFQDENIICHFGHEELPVPQNDSGVIIEMNQIVNQPQSISTMITVEPCQT